MFCCASTELIIFGCFTYKNEQRWRCWEQTHMKKKTDEIADNCFQFFWNLLWLNSCFTKPRSHSLLKLFSLITTKDTRWHQVTPVKPLMTVISLPSFPMSSTLASSAHENKITSLHDKKFLNSIFLKPVRKKPFSMMHCDVCYTVNGALNMKQ